MRTKHYTIRFYHIRQRTKQDNPTFQQITMYDETIARAIARALRNSDELVDVSLTVEPDPVEMDF